MICMSITSTHNAIARNTKEAAETRQNEGAERARNFKEAQSQYPAKTLIEITSSKELLRTTERDNLFNGPWLQRTSPFDPPTATIQVWKINEGKMQPCEKALTDQSGMLDTARYKLWENIKSTMPLPENLAETELLRETRSWHQQTNPPAPPST